MPNRIKRTFNRFEHFTSFDKAEMIKAAAYRISSYGGATKHPQSPMQKNNYMALSKYGCVPVTINPHPIKNDSSLAQHLRKQMKIKAKLSNQIAIRHKFIGQRKIVQEVRSHFIDTDPLYRFSESLSQSLQITKLTDQTM